MNCAEFNDAVVDIARGVDVSGEAVAHAAACEACAEALAGQQEIVRGLEMLAVEFQAERPSASVERNLLAAYRENRQVGIAARRVVAPSEQRQGYWLRAAAAVLVVFGFGAWLLLSSGAPESGRIAAGTSGRVPALPTAAAHAGEFVPVLGYGPVSAADSGVVVRVLLPEDAFQYFAVPVARMPGGQRFPADVLIADDGSVRAIRLVTTADGRR
jgi:hypothetical protein